MRRLIVLCLFTILLGPAYAQPAPQLGNVENTPLTFTEEDTPQVVSRTINLTADAPITRTVVQLGEGYQAGIDQLQFNDTESVRGIFDANTGILQLLSYPAGSAKSPAVFQEALRSVAYQNLDLTNPSAGNRTVSFQAFDAQGLASNTVSRTINVVATNDAPTVRLPDSSPIFYSVNIDEEREVFNGLSITDPDDNLIAGATVSITNTFYSSEDKLFFTDIPNDNITQVRNARGDTAFFSGTASIDAYQNALRQVRFDNSPPSGIAQTRGIRTITCLVSDGSDAGRVARYVVVDGFFDRTENIPPVVSDITQSVASGTLLSFNQDIFNERYTDPPGSLQRLTILSKPNHGILRYNGEEVTNAIINRGLSIEPANIGLLTYQPNLNFTGQDSFRWNASDGEFLAANDAQVIFNINPAERPVTLTLPPAITVNEDQTIILPVIGLDATPQAKLSLSLVVTQGVFSLDPTVLPLVDFSLGDGAEDDYMILSGSTEAISYLLSGIRYTPNANVSGEDALSITLAASSTNSTDRSLPITITPVDDAAQLRNLETEALSYTEGQAPVTVTNQLIIEDPDSGAPMNIAAATVTVSKGFVAGEDSLNFTSNSGIVGSQTDSVLILSGLASLKQYEVALRSVTYQNVSDNPLASKTLTFQVEDEQDSASDAVSRTVTIQPVEDTTQLVNLEDFAINYVVGNPSAHVSNTVTIADPDSDSLNRVVIFFTAGYSPDEDSLFLDGFEELEQRWNDRLGRLTLFGRNALTYYNSALRAVVYRSTSTETDDKVRTISIQTFDRGVPSNIVSRSVVLIDNLPPVVNDFSVNTLENQSLIFSLADFNAHYSDPDNAPNVGSAADIRIVTLPTQGVLLLDGDTLRESVISRLPKGYAISAQNVGKLRYVPKAGYEGSDAFTWNAFDGAEVAATTAQVAITIAPELTVSIVAPTDSICVGQTDTLTLSVEPPQGDYTYEWVCEDDCSNATSLDKASLLISPTAESRYSVTVSRADESVARDTVVVLVQDCAGVRLAIPQGFTPDGDGVNDTWTIPNLGAFPDVAVRVFDRFGHTVYESPQYDNQWQGTYDGQPLPTGTYYYSITTGPDRQTYRGAVTILR